MLKKTIIFFLLICTVIIISFKKSNENNSLLETTEFLNPINNIEFSNNSYITQEKTDSDCNKFSAETSHAVSFEPSQTVAETKIKLKEISISGDLNNSDVSPSNNLALFSLSLQCTDIGDYFIVPNSIEEISDNVSRDVCEKIPTEFKRNPILVLERSLDNSSSDYKLLYAKNSLITANLITATQKTSDQNISKSLKIKSEKITRELAESGSLDALVFMSQEYERGGFGYIDMKKAYLSSLAAKNFSNSDQDIKRLEYIYKNMTSSEFKEAEQIRSKCILPGKLVPAGAIFSPF